MKKYIEFSDFDSHATAVSQLNDFIAKADYTNVTVEGYQQVRYEQTNYERTYILASYEEVE